MAVARADRMSGERRYRRQQPHRGHQQCRVERIAEPGRSERHGAEMTDHHGVGHLHRHLRQVGGGERCRDTDGGADLTSDRRADGGHSRRTLAVFPAGGNRCGHDHAVPRRWPRSAGTSSTTAHHSRLKVGVFGLALLSWVLRASHRDIHLQRQTLWRREADPNLWSRSLASRSDLSRV